MYKLRNYEESQAWLKGFKLMYCLKFNFFSIILKSSFDSFLDFLGLNFERTLFVFHISFHFVLSDACSTDHYDHRSSSTVLFTFSKLK